MQPSPRPGVSPKQFVLVAAVCGTLMVAAVLLWFTDVIPFGAMVGVLVVAGIVELGAIVLLQRRAKQQRSRAERLSLEGGTSTIGPDSPDVRYGYDPMGDQNAGR